MAYLNKATTAADICKKLRLKHKDDLWFEEVRLSSGFAWQGRIDFMSLDPAPSTGNLAIAYEVKVTKSDFKKDTYDKQRGARLYSDRFYYIAPAGLLEKKDIPDWAGFMEVGWRPGRYGNTEPYLEIKELVPSPKRDKDSPSWGLVCSLIRNSKRQGGST